MRYKRQLVSSIVISIVVGLGFFVLISNQAKAQEQCDLSVTKVALPADDTVFTFIGSGDDDFTFFISDPSDPTSSGFIEVNNTVTITEELPPGWELDNIECTEGSTNCGGQGIFVPCLSITIDEETNSITAFCDDIDTGSCTFTNVRIPRDVPTLSEWGLIAMAGVLGIVGFMVMRRKKVTA